MNLHCVKMFLTGYFIIILCSAHAFGKNVPLEDGPLNLTPLVEKGEIEKARNLSAVDPTLFAGLDSHAAYFTVDMAKQWNTFFWFFPAQGLPLNNTPWFIWLQGGPGLSSLYGLFNEIGPLRIVDGKAEKMPITWGSNYSLLFIDNPVGTGFSYTEGEEYATNEDMVGASLLNFLQQFLEVFPELRKAPLFIAGESYAGKYILAFGHYIHHSQNESKPIYLKGLVIGDGFIDPPSLLHYSEMALHLGLLDQHDADVIHDVKEFTRYYWERQDYLDYAYEFQLTLLYTLQETQVSPYNYLKNSKYTLDNQFETFLNDAKVQSALHVKKTKYQAHNYVVYDNLLGEMFMTVKPWLEELLEHYAVLCYSGQLDFIVGYTLSVHMYQSLNWSGANDYLNAHRLVLNDYDPDTNTYTPVAYVKKAGNFVEAMVSGAGHMVPAEKPREIRELIV